MTFEDLKAISDHLRSMRHEPVEPIYMTRQEWDELCVQVPPVKTTLPSFVTGGIPVKIVTEEQKQAYNLLKILKQKSDEEARQV